MRHFGHLEDHVAPVHAFKQAGIEGFHWHDLRHTFAARLVMADVNLRTVQELLGHKTMAMAERYSHLSPGHQLDAVQRLSRSRTGTTTGTGSLEGAVNEEPPNGIEPSTCRLRIGCSAI